MVEELFQENVIFLPHLNLYKSIMQSGFCVSAQKAQIFRSMKRKTPSPDSDPPPLRQGFVLNLKKIIDFACLKKNKRKAFLKQ